MFLARSHAFRRLASQAPTSITSSSQRWQRMQSSVAQQNTESSDSQATAAIVTALADVLKPREVVNQLDKFIVGQNEAKRAVAIALRNRWRRQQMGEDLRKEVIPKNILMIGPTGCGKTEIARRIAKLSQAPFIKVEATKFTEVGFHGKDVDQIIRDLLDVSISMTKKRFKDQIKANIAEVVEDRLVKALVGASADEKQIQAFRDMLRSGQMESNTVTIDVPFKSVNGDSRVDNPNELVKAIRAVSSNVKYVGGERKTTVAEARVLLEESETERQLENLDVNKEAIAMVEESGIVFIDEIDKLISSDDYKSADASSEGVQRDLLPLIEGSTISTKHGNVNTDFILFIASGAFHAAKPSSLLAELQGRLPIRVTLQGLTEDDLYRILTEPVNNLIYQQIAMLKSENLNLVFTEDAIRELAKVAHATNKSVENIGARRLHTVIERVVEEISFEASERAGETVTIDAEYVQKRVAGLLTATDLRKYII